MGVFRDRNRYCKKFYWAHPVFCWREPSLGVMTPATLWTDATMWSHAQQAQVRRGRDSLPGVVQVGVLEGDHIKTLVPGAGRLRWRDVPGSRRSSAPSPATHVALEMVDVSPALGLFVQPAWPCNHLWCIRRACSARGLGKEPLFREMEGPLLSSRLRKRTWRRVGRFVYVGWRQVLVWEEKRRGSDQNEAGAGAGWEWETHPAKLDWLCHNTGLHFQSCSQPGTL